MLKSEAIFLRHILDEANFCIKHTILVKKEKFEEDEVLQKALIRSLEIIGEASSKVTLDFKQKYPEVNWREMKLMRNKLIHHYFGVDLDLVWDTLVKEIPVLKQQIEFILVDL